MKVCNEETMYRMLDYIKEYQARNGKSPSYRTIMKEMKFSSLSMVFRYISKLQSQGLIEKSKVGEIEIPFKLKASHTFTAPLIGTVTCGNPISAVENYEGNYSLSSDLCGSGISFILRAKGNSMKNAGIRDEDLLFVKKQSSAEDGEIVVALIGEEATVKRLFHRNGKIILHPENEEYKDFVLDKVDIIGVVKSYIHKFN